MGSGWPTTTWTKSFCAVGAVARAVRASTVTFSDAVMNWSPSSTV
jgi:hypothetical protein